MKDLTAFAHDSARENYDSGPIGTLVHDADVEDFLGREASDDELREYYEAFRARWAELERLDHG